jgi:hypothetical protein
VTRATGLALLLLVGISFSLSHAFALLANRLTPRQILVRLLLDALVLALAFLLACGVDMVLLAALATPSVRPSAFLAAMDGVLAPGLAYGLVAAPYIGAPLAVILWALIHLGTVQRLHQVFGLPWLQALTLSTPGFLVALALVALLFRQSWQSSYRMLAGEVEAGRVEPAGGTGR